MAVELKAGTLSDFFASAKEIDTKQRLTPKNIIWVTPSDLIVILKPERTKLVQYLKKKKKVVYSELISAMERTPVSLNNEFKAVI